MKLSTAILHQRGRFLVAGGLAVILLASMTACGGGSDGEATTAGTVEETSTSSTARGTTSTEAGNSTTTGSAGPTSSTTARKTTTTTRPRATTTTTIRPPATPAVANETCTADLLERSRTQPVLFGAADMEAMVLTGAELGSAVTGLELDWFRSGYADNAEFKELFSSPSATCDDFVRFARITGYVSGFDNMSSRSVHTGTHLFFDEQAARDWIGAFTSGMQAATGTKTGPDRATVSPLPGVDGGVRLDLSNDGWSSVYSLFPVGPLVGTVLESHGPGIQFRLDLPAASARLAARIGDVSARAATRGAPPVSMAQLLTGPLPHADFGPAYARLRWDWLFGGCLDNREQVQNSVDGPDEQADIDRFGRLVGCRGMYSENPEIANSDLLRIFSAVTQFRDAAGAGGYLDDQLVEMERLAGTTHDGTAYLAVERFPVIGVGDQASGIRMTFRQNDRTVHYTGAFFRQGALTGSVVLHEYTGRDARSEIAELARHLDSRLRTVVPGGGL